MRETYCGHIGVEYMHIQDPAEKSWIQARVEGSRNRPGLSKEEKIAALEHITRAEAFEQFLNKKYTGTKRFGLDGGESTMAALEEILRRGSELGLEEVVVGMPAPRPSERAGQLHGQALHRHLLGVQGGASHPEDVGGSGDVKYHLGTSTDRTFRRAFGAPVAERQPLAPGSGQPRGGRAPCAPSRTSAATMSASR